MLDRETRAISDLELLERLHKRRARSDSRFLPIDYTHSLVLSG